MHVQDGILRAYIDGELTSEEQDRLHNHLETCETCKERMENIQTTTSQIDKLLRSVEEDHGLGSPDFAYSKFESLVEEREANMWEKFSQRKYRPVYVGLGIALLFFISLSIPQVRTMANEFLSLFRIERITTVDIGLSLEEVPDEFERYFTTADRILGEDLNFEQLSGDLGEAIPVADSSEASAEVGFTVRLPTAIESEPELLVQPGATMSVTIDRDRWQSLLEELGYGDYSLPESVDGEQVSITATASVAALYGECEEDEEDQYVASTKSCTVILQGRSPIVEAPPDFDIQQLGAIGLQLLGLAPEDAEAFSASVDWTSTLVIPIPKGAKYQKITVDGVDGILLEDPYKDAKTRLTVLWLKNGIIYSMYGEMDIEQALEIVNSLE